MKNQPPHKSFLSIFEESQDRNGHAYPSIDESAVEYEEESLLTDELDHAILMHRDAHFGGDFQVMLTYYEDEQHIGVNPDFDLERIAYLAEVEGQIGQDLSPMILSGPEVEHIARARRAYELVKEVYESEEREDSLARLIADLILSEEEEPEEEIEAVVNQGSRIAPDLLQIIQSQDAYDPLFPGYGYAPYLAILCLGKIKDERAVLPLFELLGMEMSFDEGVIFQALFEIGEPAKAFLLKRVAGRPITEDNVNAALALTAFAQDRDVAVASFNQLQDADVQSHRVLSTYLVCMCDPLKGTEYQEAFISLSKNQGFPPSVRAEIERMTKNWT